MKLKKLLWQIPLIIILAFALFLIIILCATGGEWPPILDKFL